MLSLKKKPLVAELAKENLKTSTGGTKPQLLPNLAEAAIDTREVVAKDAGKESRQAIAALAGVLEYEGIVKTKHSIGKRILEDEAKFGKPEYGQKKIESLAKDIGVSRTDLYQCIQFARQYPELSAVADNLSWRKIRHNLLPEPKTKPDVKITESSNKAPVSLYQGDMMDILESLGKSLAKDMGVSRADLYLCIRFARQYPELCTTVQNLSWR